MPYKNTITGALSLTKDDVMREANATFPDHAPPAGFEFYEAASHPGDPTKIYSEAQPVNGVQAWTVAEASDPLKEQRLAEAKTNLKAAVTALRYQKETAGIVFNGASIKTDRESQAQLNAAYSSLKDGLVGSIDWKAQSGWVTLNTVAVGAIAGAVAAHVQACFTNEKAHHAAIDSLTDVSTAYTYDISAGW